jgi:hypothetical protein
MHTYAARWLLAPMHQWRAHRLMAEQGPTLPYPTAWALVLLSRHPDELAFVRSARYTNATDGADAGLSFDDWGNLATNERTRRAAWLQRHGHSPVRLLGLSDALLRRAGLCVVDWGPPGAINPQLRGNSLT